MNGEADNFSFVSMHIDMVLAFKDIKNRHIVHVMQHTDMHVTT